MDIRKLAAKVVTNWPVKVLSLGLAIILFVFNRMSTLEERFFSAPLAIELKSTLAPSGPYPRVIRVGLRGEANNIYPIMEEDIEVFVDMDSIGSPGTYRVPVQWRKKGTAQGVEPLQITVEPMEITLALDNKISKFVPLAADFRGQVDSGYSMTSYSLNPTQVVIDGPAGLMGSVSELRTEIIELDGRQGDFSEIVRIMNDDPLVATRGDGTARFDAVISRIIPVRNIDNVPIGVTGLGEGFIGEPEIRTASIHLEGENQEAVDAFETPPDFLRIDCSGITEPGTYVLTVSAGPVEKIGVLIEPEEVKILIRQSGDSEP